MFQMCWNNLHWGNYSSFQASAITHPAAHRCCSLTGVANVSGKGNSGWTLSLLLLVLSHAWSQSSAGPKQDQTLGTGFAMSCRALPSALSDLGCPGCCPARMLPLPVCRTLGGCKGLPEFEDCFLSYYKFLQCEPLMFSMTQAERTC